MKLNTTFATIIVTFVMLTVPFSIMGDSNATNITNDLSSEDLESSNTDIQIAILSDNAKSIIAPLSFGTSKIDAISTLNQVTNQSVVIIDSDWANSNSFTFAGYSTNPNATSAEYDINDQICIDSDLTLYMVWVPNE